LILAGGSRGFTGHGVSPSEGNSVGVRVQWVAVVPFFCRLPWCLRGKGWYSACIVLVRALDDALRYGAAGNLARKLWCSNNSLITMD
jgi:hypothetical protein